MPMETVTPGGDQGQVSPAAGAGAAAAISATVSPSGPDDTSSTATTPGPPAAAGPEGASATGAASPPAPTADADVEGETGQGLITQEEYDRLKADPDALIKALNRNYTQKMQGIARVRDFVSRLQEDPATVVAEMAQELGLQLVRPPDAAVATNQVAQDIFQQLSDAVGPETAQQLMPAMAKLVDQMVAGRLGPVEAGLRDQQARTAVSESVAVVEAFGAKYPDWKQYESAMVNLGQSIMPTGNINEFQWMEHLYTLAKSQDSDASRVRSVVDRMGKSVAAARAAAPRGVPASRVSPSAPHKPTWDEAFQAAKRGERWE